MNSNWASDHWPFLVLGTTGRVSGKTLEPGSYNTGIWTVAPWVIYSDKSTVCTFPHPSLYSFLSFLCQRSPLPREEVGPPNQNFQEVSSFNLRLWDFHQISVCVNAVNTLVWKWAKERGLNFLWEHNMPESQTWVCLRIPWPQIPPSGFPEAWACRASCWMAWMRVTASQPLPTKSPILLYGLPCSHNTY